MKRWRFLPGIAAVTIFVLLVAAAIAWNIQTNDLIFLPAPAQAIDAHVLSIAGHPQQPHRGMLYMTYIYEEQANLLTKFYQQHFNSDATIVPYKVYYGTSAPPPQKQQQQQSAAEMLDSKTAAQIAALDALGYTVPDEEVQVTAIDPHSKAAGKLRAGDVILSAQGHVVHSREQLIRFIGPLPPGTAVALLVQRTGPKGDTHRFHLTVTLIRGPATGTTVVRVPRLVGGKRVGTVTRRVQTYRTIIGIETHAYFPTVPRHLPFKITFDTGDIGGPSAGLMFTLSIINRLSPVDLTHGHKIAGTGEIDADGFVYPIGGVKQKVIGAREAGAQYFFVPAYCDQNICNYREAKPYARGITLVPVGSLDDALAFLRTLR